MKTIHIYKDDDKFNYTQSNHYIEGAVWLEMMSWELKELQMCTLKEIDLILYRKLTTRWKQMMYGEKFQEFPKLWK